MPETFVTNKDEDKIVSEMGRPRACIFVGVTNGFAEALGKPRCITFNGLDYVINEEEFCALVELMFTEHSTTILFGWAEYAAGMYQTIKGQVFDWYWRDQKPLNCSMEYHSRVFRPFTAGVPVPTEHSGKEIGRSHPK